MKKMKKLLSIVSLLGGVVLSSQGALDLTPREVPATGDGPHARRYFFQDGSERIAFRIDNNMAVSGAAESVAFQFSDLKTSGMKILRSPKNPEASFDGKNLEEYQNIARGLIPANATEIKIEEEKPNPIVINEWTSHQFVFTYNLFGFPYRRSVTFLNYNRQEQLVLDISAAAPDYEKTYLRGYRVLNSISDLATASSSGPT